jgi:NAD(P)-dependent dehydrogenase (short-subunit alcohol dehydrogenase family)
MRPLAQQVVLITGATDGLGRLVATHLATGGASVLLHGRDPDKGRALVEELRGQTANEQLRYYNADLASLADVRALATQVSDAEPALHTLVNNAGIGPRKSDPGRRSSADGHELMFAVNYLAGYLLTRELLPLLRRSAPARIVNVASIGQQELDFDDLMLTREYDGLRAYRQSKLAQIMFTIDLAEELQGSGVTVNCLHPATLMNTRMVLESGIFPGPMTTTGQGAAAVERLVTAPELDDVTGRYFDGMQEARANAQAYDAAARSRLAALSAALTRRGET